jgi:hypothetical protein
MGGTEQHFCASGRLAVGHIISDREVSAVKSNELVQWLEKML